MLVLIYFSKVEIIYSVLYIEQRNFASPETTIKYSEDIVIKSGLDVNLSGIKLTVVPVISGCPREPGLRRIIT